MSGPRLTLLGAGDSLATDLLRRFSHSDPAADWQPSFVSCQHLPGLHLDLGLPTLVGAVQLYFLGCAESETWNSWLRSPRLPPLGSLRLVSRGVALPAVERRTPTALHPQALAGDTTQIELSFPPQQLSELTIEWPPGRWALARLAIAEAAAEPTGSGPRFAELDPPVGGLWDQPQLGRTGDPLAEKLRQISSQRGHPTDAPPLDDAWQLAMPYRGGALLGLPDGPVAYQLWDGSLVVRSSDWLGLHGLSSDRVLLRLDLGGRPLLPHSQQLSGGYLPLGEIELTAAGLTVEQSAFVDSNHALRLALRLTNRSAAPATVTLHALAARRLVADNDRSQQAEVHTPLGCQLADSDDELRLTMATWPPPRCTVPPGEQREVTWKLQLDAPPRAGLTLAAERQSLVADSNAFLTAGAQLELPDSHLGNLWRALLLHNRLFVRDGIMRYGLFPGLYENALFGVEEGWNIVAMAQYGHPALAMALLERTFLDAEFLQKSGPHHQYRNGLAITYALDVYSLTADRAWLARIWPTLRASADWIASACASTRVLEAGQRPPHFGLLPKHIYGGDLREPAYSLYATSACWRGLRDAARVASILGESVAGPLADSARTVRADLWTAAQQIYRHDASPPFLPFRTDETSATPSSGDYHQLFASLILETAAFGWSGPFAVGMTDYLEQSGRQVLGVPRFDPWFDRLGVDAEYARGSQLAALQRRQFDRFLLGLTGQLALSCDPYTFVSPETVLVRFSAAEQQDRLRVLATQAARADSDPCSAGTGVMLQYLRYLLCWEERDEDDLPIGRLWLGAAAPAAWFRPGQSFGASELPTLLGPISFRCTTSAQSIVYEVTPSQPVELELFSCDRSGQRRSQRVKAAGPLRLALARS